MKLSSLVRLSSLGVTMRVSVLNFTFSISFLRFEGSIFNVSTSCQCFVYYFETELRLEKRPSVRE